MRASGKRSWPVGYKPNEAVKPVLEDAKKTNTLKSILAALTDHAKVFASAYLGVIAYLYLPLPVSLLIHLALWTFIAHAQRGCENLVHEASHKNWSRGTRQNDLLANMFAALPVGKTVKEYRKTHKRHHERFGSTEDSDREDFDMLELESLSKESKKAFAIGVVKKVPKYALISWKSIKKTWKAVAAAHLLYVGILCLLFGSLYGPILWLVYWLVPFVFFLTPLRLVAESSEHTYKAGETVFDTTITNCGWLQRYFIHPHNDGYHTLHHVYPTIPHSNLKRTHQRLLELDPSGYTARLRFRTRVVQNPVQNEQCPASGLGTLTARFADDDLPTF